MHHPQITPEMIERAAQAIRDQFAAQSSGRQPRPWQALPATLRNAYRAEAQAALFAAINAGTD